jgi:MSHA pilin protein MshA
MHMQINDTAAHRSIQHGFTLVELVIVIVILAILAAIALPRYINVTNQARIAAVNGVAGGIRSAVAVAQAAYFAAGNTAATTVTMIGIPAPGTATVTAGTGILTGNAAGLGAAMQAGNTAQPIDGWVTSYAAIPNTFTPPNGSATCRVEYTPATGAVAAQVGGC